MAVREAIDKKKPAAMAAAGAMVAAAGIIIGYYLMPAGQATLKGSYYSDDDGQSWFADAPFRVTPFDHNGKQAVGAAVFSCDGGGKKYVGYLVRIRPDAQKAVAEAAATAEQEKIDLQKMPIFGDPNLWQIKAPGEANWHPKLSPAGVKLMSGASPDGSSVSEVLP